MKQPYKGDGFTTYFLNMTSQKWLTGRSLHVSIVTTCHLCMYVGKKNQQQVEIAKYMASATYKQSISYSTVVGNTKVRGFWLEIITLKPA